MYDTKVGAEQSRKEIMEREGKDEDREISGGHAHYIHV